MKRFLKPSNYFISSVVVAMMAMPVVAGEKHNKINVDANAEASVETSGMTETRVRTKTDASAKKSAITKTNARVESDTSASVDMKHHAQRPALFKASKWIGANVHNASGEVAAKIKDAVFDANGQHVQHIILEGRQGAILGVGGKMVTRQIAWSDLHTDANGKLRINTLASTDLTTIGQTVTETRHMVDHEVKKTTDKINGTIHGVLSAEAKAHAKTDAHARPHRLSTLLETHVFDANGKRLGNVVDAMIDKRTGVVAYTLVTFDGLADATLRHRTAAVPVTALTFTQRAGTSAMAEPGEHDHAKARIDASTESLAQITFEPEQMPELVDSDYTRRVDKTFGQPVNWDVYGYGESKSRMDIE